MAYLPGRTSPAEPNENLPLTIDFGRLPVESVSEGIEEVLGKDSTQTAFRLLERDVIFDKLPKRLPTFYSALKKNFGRDCGTMEAAIAKKLYLKLSLELAQTSSIELSRCVEAAYIKLSQRERDVFGTSIRKSKPLAKQSSEQF